MFKILRRVNSESSASSGSSTHSAETSPKKSPISKDQLGNGNGKVEPLRLLSSKSPVSELPRTLAEYNMLYQ